MASSGRGRLPLIAAAIVGVLLVIVVQRLSTDDDPGVDEGSPAAPARDDCIALAVTASSEKAALLGQLAGAYHQADRTFGDDQCAQVTVTSKASGGAMEALARGWDEQLDGPRPDVWSPASSSWTALLRQRLAARDAPGLVPDGELPSLARTPLVLAMPRPMAEALGWPRTPLGWGDILALARNPQGWAAKGHPEWGRFTLGKTNPNFSTSGLHATIGSYFAATGLSSDLTVNDIAKPTAVDYVKGVESSVVHYGDTTLTFLSNLQKADDRGQGLTYISAATVEEKSVWDYNQGNPTGDPATLGDHKPPRTPLVAIYPKEGTLNSDNPYVVLTGDWVDDAKRAAADDFLEFVRADAQQRRFTAAAFRDAEGEPGDLITLDNGLIAEEPRVVLSPPSPPVMDRVLQSWQQHRKRARVLLVFDVSGSMGDAVPSAGESKLELAKRAATRALGGFAPDDELGLWIFSTDLDEGRPYLPLVPIGPVKAQLPVIRQRIAGLAPGGGTALYATTRQAQRAMAADTDPTRINAVVVLTDGRNEYPADTNLESLLDELSPEAESDAVRVFPIAYGDDADLETLRRIADAARAAAYDASDPASIDKVFTAVISNF